MSSCATHTTGFDELARRARPASRSTSSSGRPGASRADMARFARMYAAAGSAVLVWSMGITQHEHGVDNVAAIVNLGARAGQRRPAGRRAHADPRPLRRAGRRRDGRVRHRVPGRRARRRPRTAAAVAEQYGFPVRGEPGLSAAEMVEAAGDGRARRPLLERRQLPRGAPRPAGGRGRAGDGAAARPPGHRRVEPDARRPGRDRRAAAGRDPLRAARRRHRDDHRAPHRVQPRDPRSASRARRAASGRSSSTWRGASIRRARTLMDFQSGAGDPRRDRPRRAVVRRGRATARHR